MARITTYPKAVDFLNANRKYIYDDYFVHYHLINTIDQLTERKIDLYDCYNIVDEDGSYVLCMWVTGSYLIYAKAWNEKCIAKLSEKIDLKKFTHFSFVGQRELIKSFFAFCNIEGEVFKNRCIEICESVNQPVRNFSGRIENGDFEDFNELVQMSYDYNQEEFRGEGFHTQETIAMSVEAAIIHSKIFIWRDADVIVSMVQVLDNHPRFAFIGSLYTKPAFRSRGYGYYIMHSLVAGLLGDGCEKCGLVSDADNPVTKQIFARVGFNPIYEWVLIRKEH